MVWMVSLTTVAYVSLSVLQWNLHRKAILSSVPPRSPACLDIPKKSRGPPSVSKNWRQKGVGWSFRADLTFDVIDQLRDQKSKGKGRYGLSVRCKGHLASSRSVTNFVNILRVCVCMCVCANVCVFSQLLLRTAWCCACPEPRICCLLDESQSFLFAWQAHSFIESFTQQRLSEIPLLSFKKLSFISGTQTSRFLLSVCLHFLFELHF